MPELPEVQTTVNGLRRHVLGKKIAGVWTSYNSPYFAGSGTIKDPAYFRTFEKQILGRTIVSVDRRAKNILINLDGGLTILVHMKMTGHLLYGRYRFVADKPKDPWQPIEPESLKDPFNRHVRLMLTFTDGTNLALSDMRKFAKVLVADTRMIHTSDHLDGIGPEPLERGFTLKKFAECLERRPNGKIKQVLMDQNIIAGVGNIYADESLWRAGIHPLERVSHIPPAKLTALYKGVLSTLKNGIDFGGDSMSDYRNILGERGEFQGKHQAYRRTGLKCRKPGFGGTIRRLVVGGRSAHYCDQHQKLSRK